MWLGTLGGPSATIETRRILAIAPALQVREEPGGDVGGDRSVRQTCAVVVEELEALGVNVDAAADVHRERGAVGLRPGVERVESAGELLLGGMVHWMFLRLLGEPTVHRLVRPEAGHQTLLDDARPALPGGLPVGETGKARGRTREGPLRGLEARRIGVPRGGRARRI